jgi:hypothetical protein
MLRTQSKTNAMKRETNPAWPPRLSCGALSGADGGAPPVEHLVQVNLVEHFIQVHSRQHGIQVYPH